MSAIMLQMACHVCWYLFVIFPDNIPADSWILIKFTVAIAATNSTVILNCGLFSFN